MSRPPASGDGRVLPGERIVAGGLVSSGATCRVVAARTEITGSLEQRIDAHARAA